MTVDIDLKVLDHALIESALHLTGERGWNNFSLIDAARDAGVPIAQVRSRYPFKAMVLLRLNRLADEVTLYNIDSDTPLREKLFDLFMRRFDVFQEYRCGLKKVLRSLPFNPALAALAGTTTLDSMRWIANCAGLDLRGFSGILRLQGLSLVWAHALRNWEKDDTPDLSNTMNALDHALNRAERFGFLKEYSKNISAPKDKGGLPDHNPT